MSDSINQIIIHPGVVDHIDHDKVFVRILSQSACATCHAKGACSISEVEEKIIEVRTTDQANYHKGDHVTVRMKQSAGKKAVVLGYIVPLVILVTSIIILVSFMDHEGLAALIALLLLGPYYLILYFLRNKLKEEFKFSLYNG